MCCTHELTKMDMDEVLIEAVRNFPCLWQASSKKYKDLRAKENARKEVAKEVCKMYTCKTMIRIPFLLLLQIASEVGECQRRWKPAIRDHYVRELRRVKKRKSGDGASDVYIPSWSLYKLLSFLNESVEHRQ